MLFWLILVSVIEKSHICWSLILPVYLFMWPDFVRLRTFTQFLFASVYGAKWSSRVWYYQATIHVRHCLVLASLGKWAMFWETFTDLWSRSSSSIKRGVSGPSPHRKYLKDLRARSWMVYFIQFKVLRRARPSSHSWDLQHEPSSTASTNTHSANQQARLLSHQGFGASIPLFLCFCSFSHGIEAGAALDWRRQGVAPNFCCLLNCSDCILEKCHTEAFNWRCVLYRKSFEWSFPELCVFMINIWQKA